MSVDTEFDLGSLTWVKGELDVALESARTALADWNGEDSNPLKAAAAYLHQVYGALQIVDLQGVSLVASETERLLAEMVKREEIRDTQSAETVLRAIASLKRYLDELMTGARPAELKLAATLNAVVTRRGGEALAPSELFYPDTGVRVPRETPDMLLDESTRNRTVRTARLRYQKGLLQFLQNKDAKQGLEQMSAAVADVEKVAQGPAQYTFWWTAAALMDALRRDSVPTDFWLKRLCGRIDMQMRRLMDGSRQLADRLVRDVLFYVAKDSAPSGRTVQVQNAFELARFFPAAEPVENIDARVHLSLLRDNLATAKDHWIRYCAGRAESLQPFQSAALTVFEAATRLANPDMQSLMRMVQAVAKRLPGEADATHNEALQLEMATALLLAQNATEHFAALGVEFRNQAATQTMRLQAAIDPNFDSSTIPDVPMLDEMTRAAQEKLVLEQVTQEIQANLNRVEEVLDRFFRDANDRSGLPTVPNLMKQILGALNILQLDVAAALVRESISRIEHFSEADALIAPENLNWVAEALSTLGIYLDALRHGRDDTQILSGLLAQPEVILEPEVSVEEQIVRDIDRIKDTVSQWGDQANANGSSPDERAALKSELSQLARDADLVGDAGLRSQADAAMKALDASTLGGDTRQVVMRAVQNLGAPPQSMEAPAPTAESMRLAAASDEDVDTEMLSTFIEEAQEVLGNIAAQVARLNVSPYDKEAFTSIRRSFHTLKGSGRMVGLTDLAEPAWEIEQTLNAWLRDDKVPSTEMLDFLEGAGNTFLVWVSSLEEQGSVRVISGPLIQGARKLRGEPTAAETPPPKAEADVLAPVGQDVGKTETDQAGNAVPAESLAVADATDTEANIGGHILPAELFAIFSKEAVQRLSDLNAGLAEMARGQRSAAWEAFIRAAHTLAGISRTTGFQPLAEAAHEVEIWASQWPDKTVSLADTVVAQVAYAIDHLTQAVQGILARKFPLPMPEVPAALAMTHALLPTGTPAVAQSADQCTLPAPAVDVISEPGAPAGPDAEADADADADAIAALQALATEVLVETTQPHPPSAGPAPVAHDEFDEQLLPIFLEEAAELLPRIGSVLRQWRSAPASTATRDELKRALHTLKGSARMAGAMRLGEIVHQVETRVIERGDQPATPTYLDSLEAEYDHFTDIVELLKTGASELAGAPLEADNAADPADMAQAEAASADFTESEDEPESDSVAEAPRVEPLNQGEMRVRQSLRLKADIMDTLLNEAGEVAISRARIENVLASYKQTAQELAGNVERLRSQLRELEIQAESQMHSRLSQVDESHFDPLEFDRFTRLQELTRLMAESVNDVSTAQENLLSGLNETDNALRLQSRMTRNLQQELMHIRMVPLNTLAERLYRVVRQTGKETGRKAQMELDGGQTEMDRAVLDKIAAPLEHLVRNAVAHGIETPETRLQAGKTEYGELRLSARQEGNEIVISLVDDGAGVDLTAVREKAETHGWLKAGEAVSHEQLEQWLFRSGFSTAKQVTEVAGRGVGLDVVRSEIAGIGGRVKLETESGKGTRFTIRLPLTLALTQVVLARAGGQTWALPASLVTLVREFKLDQIQALHDLGHLELQGEKFPLRNLADLVGRKSQPVEGRFRTILLLRAGEQHLAVRIDALEGNYEAVVKNIGPQLARIAGISGATVLGDGRVALIINPFQLAERAPEAPVEHSPEVVDLAPLIMVVDDSLTVRKITTRFLQREGYRVSNARDGVEALEMLEDEMPALMLLDIEMPRMDGFEVVRHVRANVATRSLPIIMITSRTADKHRSHALEAGVDGYMGKPFQEDELLSEIQRLTGHVMAA